MRGSSPDAALYWLARMLDGGCDPLYLARRVARMASEDIGNADPRPAIGAERLGAQERMGSPEGELAIARPWSIWRSRRKATRGSYRAGGGAARCRTSRNAGRAAASAQCARNWRGSYTARVTAMRTTSMHLRRWRMLFSEVLQTARYYQPTANGLEGRIGKNWSGCGSWIGTAAGGDT